MTTRRSLLEAAAFLSAAPGAIGAPAVVTELLRQRLPGPCDGNHSVHALEVRIGPGEASAPHQHAGFVIGYVLEGEIRFQLKGGPERRLVAGEMFYEPPGAVHQVSANASTTKPARLLALIIAPEGAVLTKPA